MLKITKNTKIKKKLRKKLRRKLRKIKQDCESWKYPQIRNNNYLIFVRYQKYLHLPNICVANCKLNINYGFELPSKKYFRELQSFESEKIATLHIRKVRGDILKKK